MLNNMNIDFIVNKLNKKLKELKLNKKIYAIGFGNVVTLLIDNSTNYFEDINFNLNNFDNDVDLLLACAYKTIEDLVD